MALDSSPQQGKWPCRLGSRVSIAFDLEGAAVFKPLEQLIQQCVHGLAALVAGDRLVQAPPDTLDRIQVRRTPGQKVNREAIAVLGQVVMDRR